jgi:RND superfamily putative drug exporter
VKSPGFKSYVTGAPALGHDYAVSSQTDIARGDMITIPILIVVLLLVFGSLVAAGVPLMLAGVSIPVSLAGVYVFAHFISTSIYATNVIEGLGLGIAIDYSLFIVYRYREELRIAGGDRERAIVRTMETTGRAAFFSGITVAIGLSALLLSGVVFMQSLGLAGILVPVSALLTAMTLLPAVLSVLGGKVNAGRVLPTRLMTPGDRGPWHRLAMGIMKRPLLAGGIALVLIVLAAISATQINYSYGGLKNAPKSLQSVQGYIFMQSHFPAVPDPILVLVESTNGTSLAGQVSRSRLTATRMYVGGSEAGYLDWDNVVLGRFPFVIGIVLLLTYGFLFLAFRSVFLPLKAVLLNLVSVAAAYGLMVLVFQGGVGSSVLGFSPEDGIATWVPVFLFAFLFGLSMDYEVLLLSRIREAWLASTTAPPYSCRTLYEIASLEKLAPYSG